MSIVWSDGCHETLHRTEIWRGELYWGVYFWKWSCGF